MKATSAEDHRLRSSFEAVRKVLLDGDYAGRLDKPLAYWALPNDRRLPLALLGRTIRDLLDTPFDELTSTPGIGQKKTGSLVKLLRRAAEENLPSLPLGVGELASGPEQAECHPAVKNEDFDPSAVSEAVWSQWCETVLRHDLGREKLGRLAPSLQSLPTVIWHTPLSAYVGHTLAEIRQLKTHGEKRVRVVLEIFCVVHEMVRGAGSHDRLVIRLTPKFVPPVEQWIWSVLQRDDPPSADEAREALALPLLDQIAVDAGETVHKLAMGRLGIKSPPQSVRTQSRRVGVTRARVYQLLDQCSEVMTVRWPEGRCQLMVLAENLDKHEVEGDALRLVHSLQELLYSSKSGELADCDLA
jgi:hypothetical protein